MAKTPLTKPEALAFVEAITSGRGRVHLGARLGYQRVPTADDFLSQDTNKADLCDDFVCELEDAVETLKAIQAGRERQLEFDGNGSGTASDEE